jgi:hypothetical protein
MKNAIFWDVMPCGSCTNRRFGETYLLHHRGKKNQQVRNNVSSSQLLVTANVVPNLLILFTMTMVLTRYSETSVL